jgi:hypothetical protein
MTGMSPPFANFTVVVTRRVLPGRATPYAFVAKVVLSSRSGSSDLACADVPRRGWACHPRGVGTRLPRLDDLAAVNVADTPMMRVLLMPDEPDKNQWRERNAVDELRRAVGT